MCASWYAKRVAGQITSANFQLHPPRYQDSDILRNECGNLRYPLYFCAERTAMAPYQLVRFAPAARTDAVCIRADT